ncbi:MAG: TSUP family transporter [Ktedonobacteraceae bacterium]
MRSYITSNACGLVSNGAYQSGERNDQQFHDWRNGGCSAGIYFSRGDVPPLVAAPVALGVLLGAFLGTRLMTRLSNKALRLIFLPVMAVIALEMVLRGLGVAPI